MHPLTRTCREESTIYQDRQNTGDFCFAGQHDATAIRHGPWPLSTDNPRIKFLRQSESSSLGTVRAIAALLQCRYLAVHACTHHGSSGRPIMDYPEAVPAGWNIATGSAAVEKHRYRPDDVEAMYLSGSEAARRCCQDSARYACCLTGRSTRQQEKRLEMTSCVFISAM